MTLIKGKRVDLDSNDVLKIEKKDKGTVKDIVLILSGTVFCLVSNKIKTVIEKIVT
jgi:hypothetical protein